MRRRLKALVVIALWSASLASMAGTSFGGTNVYKWNAEGNQVAAQFGYSVGTAGDVNGDGFDDLVVGAYTYSNSVSYQGRAFAYLGSASGLSPTPSWTADGPQGSDYFGISIGTAGDVNGDGFDDVVIGASQYDNVGAAFLFLGSASGLSSTPAWTAEGNQTSAYFGHAVGTAGDVNGDGFDDVVVGMPLYSKGQSTYEGRAFLFLGSASGLSSTAAWSAVGDQPNDDFGRSLGTAGDVNGDGFDEVVMGAFEYDQGQTNEGKAFAYMGSASGLSSTPAWTAQGNQNYAYLGVSVGTAGDVNADGFDDVVVGADNYRNGEFEEGEALAYLGSASGLSSTPAWTAEGNQAKAYFGRSVGTAGDVNGDGFDDVVVGAHEYDHGQTNEGGAFAYLGSASGLSSTPAWTADGNQPDDLFGFVVGAAGDVNEDGLDEVVVGAPHYGHGEPEEGWVAVRGRT